MKKYLPLLFLLFLSLELRAQDPLLPLRLELSSSFRADSTVYVKFLIHDGDDQNVLWSNSALDPEASPSSGTPVKLTGRTLYLLLGDGELENMETLPKDLFQGGAKRKLRVWITSEASSPYTLLSPDLDLVAAPYALRSEEAKDFDPAVVAAHGTEIAGLKASLSTAQSAIAGLQSASGAQSGPRFFVGEDGTLSYRSSSPLSDDVPPNSQPEPFDQFATHLGSPFTLDKAAGVESVTLYFADPAEIAPAGAVCIFYSALQIDSRLTSTAVSTNDFPYCVYTFSPSAAPLAAGQYYVGLKTNSNYAAIHPYVCAPYRGGGLSYYSPAAKLSATIPPQPVEKPYWKATSDEKELWARISFKEDKKFTFDGAGNFEVNGSPALTAANLKENLNALLGTELFIGKSDLDPELWNELLSSAGGSVTGNLSVASLSLPVGGNWYVGSSEAPCDLVIANSAGCLRSEEGDLVLSAAETIKPASFVDFSSSQGGRADIVSGETEVAIYPGGLSSEAVILVTPLQELSSPYWVEIDSTGAAAIRVAAPQERSLGFTYALIRK